MQVKFSQNILFTAHLLLSVCAFGASSSSASIASWEDFATVYVGPAANTYEDMVFIPADGNENGFYIDIFEVTNKEGADENLITDWLFQNFKQLVCCGCVHVLCQPNKHHAVICFVRFVA